MKKLRIPTKSYNPNDSINFPQIRQINYYKKCSKVFGRSLPTVRGLYKFEDPRGLIFHDLFAATNSALVFSQLIEDHTSSTEWWRRSPLFKNKFDNHIVKGMNVSLRNSIDFAHLHGCFMFVEETFRKLLRAINPKLVNGATGEFRKVYTCLLENLKMKHHIPIFDLFATIRNSVHNNGFYIPPHQKDIVIVVKRRKFSFKNGEPIMVNKWGYEDKYEFYLNLFNEIHFILLEVMLSRSVRNL